MTYAKISFILDGNTADAVGEYWVLLGGHRHALRIGQPTTCTGADSGSGHPVRR